MVPRGRQTFEWFSVTTTTNTVVTNPKWCRSSKKPPLRESTKRGQLVQPWIVRVFSHFHDSDDPRKNPL